jgi:group I intron endonuclease
MTIEEVNGGVYCILCKPLGKAYFGSSGHVAKRVKRHTSLLNSGKHENAKLQLDWLEHGQASFEAHIVMFCQDAKSRLKTEAKLIRAQLRDKVYNVIHRAAPARKAVAKPPRSTVRPPARSGSGELVSMQQAVKLTGFTRQTLYNRIKAGTAPAHEHVAGRYLFYLSDVVNHLKRRSKP